MSSELDQFKAQLSKSAGLALKDGVHCVKCRKPFTDDNVRTQAGWRETKITGYCEICWDELFKDSDDDF